MRKEYEHGTRSRYVHDKCRCPECKSAESDYQRKRRERDKDRLSQKQREYYQANRERLIAKQKAYYEGNRDSVRAYRERNAERIREYEREYKSNVREKRRERRERHFEANRETILAELRDRPRKRRERARLWARTPRGRALRNSGEARRRARRRGADCGCVTADLIAQIWESVKDSCVYCGAPAEHTDHIHPLARGGRHCVANIAPACAPCNLSKGAKILDDPPPPLMACPLFDAEKPAS